MLLNRLENLEVYQYIRGLIGMVIQSYVDYLELMFIRIKNHQIWMSGTEERLKLSGEYFKGLDKFL